MLFSALEHVDDDVSVSSIHTGVDEWIDRMREDRDWLLLGVVLKFLMRLISFSVRGFCIADDDGGGGGECALVV